MALQKAKIITVTSVKGGTGKSTFITSMAGILANEDYKTIIIDLDLTSGVIAPSLNVDSNQDIYSLIDDIMNGRFESIDKYIRTYSKNIDVLAAPNDPRNAGKIHSQYIGDVVKQLEYKYDFILIDTNHSLRSVKLNALDISDKILYLITEDLMDLRNMRTMISIYEDMKVKKYKILLNQAIDRDSNNYEIKNVLGRNVDYIIPKSYFEEDIQNYLFDAKILTIEKSKSKSTLEFKKIIDEIIK